MARVAVYRVYYEYKGERDEVYIQALSAQQAADFIRGDNKLDYKIIEVSKVVYNWR